MANSYVWNYVEAEQLNSPIIVGNTALNGFVFLVRFSIRVDDGSNVVTYYNQYQFPEPTSSDGYTPASEITTTMIMQWLNEALIANDVYRTETYPALQTAYETALEAYEAESPQTGQAPVPPKTPVNGLEYFQDQADLALSAYATPATVVFVPATNT